MNEILLTTWAANLMFFAQGFFFVLPGALTPVLSEYYGQSLSTVGYCLSLSVIMRIVGNILTGRSFSSIRLHKFLLRTDLALVLLLLVPMFAPNLTVFTIGNLLAALFLGTHFAVGNNLILYLYVGSKRTSQMAFLNFFYSAGAIISPLVLAFFLDFHIHWAWIFVVCAVLTTGALLALKSDENMFYKPSATSSSKGFTANMHIYISYLVMLIYVMAESVYSTWLPVFFIEELKLPLAEAAFTLVILWCGFAIGRFSCGFLASRIVGHRLIAILAGFVIVGMLLLLFCLDFIDYRISTFILGLGFSGMYSCVLSYGNAQLDNPNVKLMTILTSLGTAGVILGILTGSFLKEYMAAYPIMVIGSILFVISMAMLYFSVHKKELELS